MDYNLRLSGTVNDSIVDGPGIRYTVFVQGCPHHCPGCHNPQTHDFEGGKVADTEEIIAKFRKNPLLDGITLSGGEPFCQSEACAEIARNARNLGLNVWSYSGYTYEELISGKADDSLCTGALDSSGDEELFSATQATAKTEIKTNAMSATSFFIIHLRCLYCIIPPPRKLSTILHNYLTIIYTVLTKGAEDYYPSIHSRTYCIYSSQNSQVWAPEDSR